MNMVFLTQSRTLAVFYDVANALHRDGQLDKVSFYISDSAFFDTFAKEHSDIESGRYVLSKEWEIIGDSRNHAPNISRLKEYERKYGDPVLWNALVADRRIYLGKRATLEQDYTPRFSHERMLSILQVSIERMEELFDSVQPDAVVGFICVTIGEYLASLIAKHRGIPFLDLRPTRIKNYFYAGEDVLEPSLRLESTYKCFVSNGIPDSLAEEARLYLEKARKTHAMYEGVLPAQKQAESSQDFIQNLATLDSNSKIRTVANLVRQFYQYSIGRYRHDNSHRGVIYPIWFQRIKRPLRTLFCEFYLRRRYIKPHKLADIEYAFFPLHKEPEVTLLVYSRPFLNQIEVVRNIARNLPVGMKLVIKEHPASHAYRPSSYYKKLLEIPGVVMVPAETRSRDLVENARIVTIISGSIGLEALLMNKPVIHFGNVPFGCLPSTMIRHIRDLDSTGATIRDLLDRHEHNEDALLAYISAVIKSSAAVDFYSVLLERRGVYRPSANNQEQGTRSRNIQRLADYLISKLNSKESIVDHAPTISHSNASPILLADFGRAQKGEQ